MSIATTMRGELDMAYETKVLLIALAKIVAKTDDVDEIYNAIKMMANAESLVLPSREEMRKTEPEV
jgi:hypothetical protein